MKKAVKILIAASTAAAVIGVGAVSFAAWTAGGSSSADVSGNSGVIPILKFDEPQLQPISDLFPINEYGEGKKYETIKFKIDPESAYNEDNFTLLIELTDTSQLDSNTHFYATKFENPGFWEPDRINSGGIKIVYDVWEKGSRGGETGDKGADGAYTLSIYHDSSTLGDMGKTFTIKYTLLIGNVA